MGIAGRTIHVKFAVKPGKRSLSNLLSINLQSISDLIRVSRQAKNLTPGHLALKMGIAASVVLSWEDGSIRPNDWQMERLAKIFGLDPKEF